MLLGFINRDYVLLCKNSFNKIVSKPVYGELRTEGKIRKWRCVRCHLYKTITPIPMGFVFPGNVWQDGSHRTKISMTFQVLELVEK